MPLCFPQGCDHVPICFKSGIKENCWKDWFFLMNMRNVFTALLTPVVLKLKWEAASDALIHEITYILREDKMRRTQTKGRWDTEIVVIVFFSLVFASNELNAEGVRSSIIFYHWLTGYWILLSLAVWNESYLHLFQILIGEVTSFFVKTESAQEKTIVTADCCYFNPLVRRIVRFLGQSYETKREGIIFPPLRSPVDPLPLLHVLLFHHLCIYPNSDLFKSQNGGLVLPHSYQQWTHLTLL